MSILNILSLYLLFFALYLFTLCIYIFIFIYLYYVYVLFLFALLYSFCFKGKFEKYWRGLFRPKSKPSPRRISGNLCRARPERRQGQGDRFAVRLVQALQGTRAGRGYTYPTNTLKAIVGGFRGIVRGVSLSGIMAERGPAKKLPLLRGKGGHNGYYVHVLAQPMTDRHHYQMLELRCFYNKCVVFTTNALFLQQNRRINNTI